VGEFYLIRHCEAAGQGADAPLTERGRVQAEELAQRLAGLGLRRIIASPFRRAVESATPLARRLGLPLETDGRLKERVLAADDLPDWREKLAQTFRDPNLCYPGGESSRQAAARGMAVVEEALAAEGNHPFALISHGCLIALVLRELDPAIGFEDWARMTTPDVYRVTRSGPHTRVTRAWSESVRAHG